MVATEIILKNVLLLGEAIAGPGYGPGPGHLVLVRAL